MNHRSRGFSLLELLIAMSLFLVLGTALVALLTRAMDFLDSGTGGTELQDKANDFFIPFRADVEHVVVERSLMPGDPVIRFHCDLIPFDSNEDGEQDYLAQRFVFVRATNREASDPLARQAGTRAGADAYLDGKDDREEAAAGKLKALGGMEEVMYVALPDDAKDPGLLTLYRATRSPPGGAGTLFDVKKPEAIRKVAQPLLKGVLHFGVRFWTASTTGWDESTGSFGGSSPLATWDSTRGALTPGKNPERSEFLLGRGPESFRDPRDDISPRAVRATFAFQRTGRDGKEAGLLSPMDASVKKVDVANTDFAAGALLPFVKVGTEWMSVAEREPDAFKIVARGRWLTTGVAHTTGEAVRAAHGISRTITIPNYREDWDSR